MSAENEFNSLLHFFFDEKRSHQFKRSPPVDNIDRALNQLLDDGLIQRFSEEGNDAPRYILSLEGEQLFLKLKKKRKPIGEGWTYFNKMKLKRAFWDRHPTWEKILRTGLIGLFFVIIGAIITPFIQKKLKGNTDELQDKAIRELQDAILIKKAREEKSASSLSK